MSPKLAVSVCVVAALVVLIAASSRVVACEDGWIGVHGIGPGTELAGTVDFQADVKAGCPALTRMEFLVDDRVIATTTPDVLGIKWDSTKTPNGDHKLQVKGTRADNGVVECAPVTVKVTNH